LCKTLSGRTALSRSPKVQNEIIVPGKWALRFNRHAIELIEFKMNFPQLSRLLHRIYQLANHDFCPRCNRVTDWLKHPLGWIVCAVAFALLVGVLVGPQGYMLAFAFSAFLVLGLAWPWISMKGIRCQIVLPDCRVEENEELVVVFKVRNFWPLPVIGLMVKGDFLQDCASGEEPVAFALKRVGAWSESEFRITLTPRRRGQLPTGGADLATGFPFGLVDVSKPVEVPRRTIVWPSCVPLQGFPVSTSTRLCLQGALSDRVGNDGDSIGIRDYQQGDRLRNIHWAQSARSQNLVVRERQSISPSSATVVLDLSPPAHGGNGIDSSFEWTIRIAASICSHLNETQSLVRVVCFGISRLPDRAYEDNRSGLRPIMDFLATLPTLAILTEASNSAAMVKTGSVPERPCVSDNRHLILNDDRVFIIGSSRSKRTKAAGLLNLGANVTPVIVDVEGFQTEEQISSLKPITVSPRANLASSNKAIFIATPASAAEQLTTGWNRSFTDAV